MLTKDQLEKFAALKRSFFPKAPPLLNQGQSPKRFQVTCCADPDFDVSIAHPAYTDRHPTVLFDEAHDNFHTSTGRYKVLADLMINDGYKGVTWSREIHTRPIVQI